MPDPIRFHSRPSVAVVAVALISLGFAQACGGDAFEAADQAPTWDEAANASYTGIYDEPVRLTDGEYEGKPFVEGGAARPRVGLVKDFRLVGDLTGDGSPDAVFLLYENSGGSGTFSYLTVLERAPEGVVSLGTSGVGDRVQIRSAGIRDGKVVLDVVQTGPEDAACCPGEKMSRTWTLGPEGLAEGAPVSEGRLSLKDLSGLEWVLRSFGWDDPAPADPEITILFENGRLGGGSGCNTYFASAEEGEAPGDITIGAVGMTMMACEEVAMALEQRYHQALVGVVKYGFVAGRLALTSVGDDAVTTLFFEARVAEDE